MKFEFEFFLLKADLGLNIGLAAFEQLLTCVCAFEQLLYLIRKTKLTVKRHEDNSLIDSQRRHAVRMFVVVILYISVSSVDGKTPSF